MSTEQVIADQGLALAPGAGFPQLELRPQPRAARAARVWVRAQVPPLSDEQCLALEVLTSELVTNAVLHARTDVTVGVTLLLDGVLVTVTDRNLLLPEQQPDSSTRSTGRGMRILEGMSRDWGVSTHEDGKTVWFVLDRQAGPPIVYNGSAEPGR